MSPDDRDLPGELIYPMRSVMKFLTSAVFGAVLLAACSGGGSPPAETDPVMFRGDAQHTGVFHTEGLETAPGIRWRFQTGGPVRSSPTVADGIVYVGSTDGRLYALDATTGVRIWEIDVGSPVSSSPAVAEGLVLFASGDGVIRGVEAREGALRWRFDTGELLPWEWGREGWDVYLSSPVVRDESVVFGAGDGSVYALDLQTGEERWRFATTMRIRSSPAIADEAVFVGGGDGVVYRLALDDGEVQWSYETEGADLESAEFGFDRKSIIASPAVGSGLVLVGSRDGHMYALDQASGELAWRVSHDISWAMSSPALSEGALFSGTSDGLFVHRVNLDSGNEVWRLVGDGYTWSSPALVGNTVYIGDGDGSLRAVDAESGQERWSFRAGGAVYSSPWVEDAAVYFGADDGVVYALDSASPSAHRVVFWDSAYADGAGRGQERMRSFFELRGYRAVDTEELETFLAARVEDGAPSAVVFALPYIPRQIASEPSDTVLMRRYLDSGGKVVWTGPPPMSLVRDEEGRTVAFDRNRTQQVLSVDATEADFDFYGSQPTTLGRTWGLSRGWASAYAIGTESVQALALDEHGRAGAWVKSYGGASGTGFVGVGLLDVTLGTLEVVLTLAEYGLAPGAY